MTDSHPLPSIDLELPRKLQDPEYRERFFLAEASAEIARQLIKLRRRREYSQAELAERAGTQQPAVSRVEQADYQNWSFNTLRKLTNAMSGRLRVIIEPFEDVLAEYQPEEHEPIVLPKQPSDPKKSKEQDRKPPTSAVEAGQFDADLDELSRATPQDLNREPEVSAISALRKEQKRRNEQGASQWT